MKYEVKLRNTLKTNGIFSFTSGLASILFANSVAHFLGAPEAGTILLIVGFALVGFAITVFGMSSPKTQNIAVFCELGATSCR